MAEEEAEAIIRQIRRLEDRVMAREDTILYLYTVLSVRREETRMTHEQLLLTDPNYRRTWYSIRALRGWQTRDRAEIERLKKLVPPIKALRLILTFSIETGTGHEPFYAEVTCDTVIPAAMSREKQATVVSRIINAVVKLFWICFDSFKCITKDKKSLWGQQDYDRLLKLAIFFQKYAETVYEQAMDNFIKELQQKGCFERELDEFTTRQAILKIGIEYHYAAENAEPKYPTINCLIEKGTNKENIGQWVIEKKIIISEKTDVNIMVMLDMRVEE